MCATRARARTPKYIDRVCALRCLGGKGGVFLVWGEKEDREGGGIWKCWGFCHERLPTKKPWPTKDNGESGVRRTNAMRHGCVRGTPDR